MSNRILQFLNRPPCPCQAASQSLAAIRSEIERIEAAAEGCIEFLVPSLSDFIDGGRAVRLFVIAEADEAHIADDLGIYAAQQMRSIARELTAAADRLEGTVQS